MEKVILGISGGVDSAVSLKLLLDQGYQVECIFMRNWDSLLNNDIKGNPNDVLDVCPQEKDYMDALSVCEEFGVTLHRIDFVKEYWDNVFSYFLNEYKKGRTPNPDVMCNRYIKFDVFKKEAQKLGADRIAMGHFARGEVKDGRYHLYKGVDPNKDQTYFLCMTKYENLEGTLFPVGGLLKSKVREIAKNSNIPVSEKKDSTGICFIGERHFNEFLSNYLPAQKGEIRSVDGEFMGYHYGLMNYTIGQRKGLKIGGIEGKVNLPWFVCGKDLNTNTLYVSQGSENEYLLSDMCIIEDINIINPFEGELYGKFRYRAPDESISIEMLESGEARVTYTDVKSVTPGQILCIYSSSGECLGGGIIKEVYYKGKKRNY